MSFSSSGGLDFSSCAESLKLFYAKVLDELVYGFPCSSVAWLSVLPQYLDCTLLLLKKLFDEPLGWRCWGRA